MIMNKSLYIVAFSLAFATTGICLLYTSDAADD